MQTLGVRPVTLFRNSKSAALDAAAVAQPARVTRMVGGLKPTSLPSSRRKVAVKPPSTDLDAVQPLEEVDVEEGAPELAVGDAAQADLLLAAHHVRGSPRPRPSRKAAAAISPRAWRARASSRRCGRRKLPTWSAR